MLISPPFLDGVSADPFDETYVDRLMPGTGDGFFPLSARLGWHGGIHLQAPRDAQGNPRPVRAIADGTVVLVRKPEREPSTPAEAVTKSKDENEPLGYDRGWTSNGAVVIKHTTDIGANGTTPVTVTFYSVYQHLHSIPTAAEGKAIWRKDIVGTAGYIAGQQDRIHFEIVMDKANVDKLIGNSGLIGPRNPAPPTAGRTDSIWGDIYFYVPAGLPVYGVDPRTQTQHYIVKQGDTPDSIATAFNTNVKKLKKLNHHEKDSDEIFTKWINSKIPSLQPPTTAPIGHAPHHHAPPPPSPITVPQRYGGATATTPATQPASTPSNPGAQAPTNTSATPPAPDPNPPLAPIGISDACRIAMKLFKTSVMTTTTVTGNPVGSPVIESAISEYDLYVTANNFYPHSASAGYELLRFGRVIGSDSLHADDANQATHRHEHFREAYVLMSDGSSKQGFIDLNAAGVTVFSEADFSAYDGWVLIDDDSDGDARCDSPLVYGAMYATYLGAHGGELANDVISAVHKLITPKGKTADAPAASSASADAPRPAGGTSATPVNSNNTPTTNQNPAPASTTAPPSVVNLISDPSVRARMAKVIVHSPSEWDKNLVDKRWAWLTAEKDAEALTAAQGDAAKKAATPSLQPNGTLTHPGYDKFIKHVQAVAFWDDGKIGLKSADTWRFDPRQFIKMWRKCGWLSYTEIQQLLPVHIVGKDSSGLHWEAVAGSASRRSATGDFIDSHKIPLNSTLRKYLIDTPLRQAAFFAQALVETAWLTSTEENGGRSPNLHQGWYGRGFLQLTAPNGDLNHGTNNYYEYFRWRGHTPVMPPGAQENQWKDAVATTPDDATQSAGFYWIRHQFSSQSSHAKETAQSYADAFSANTRTSVNTDSGAKVYYQNEDARKTAAMVNIPGGVYNTHYVVNGMTERYCSYTNALMVLADLSEFPLASGVSETPEGYEKRLPW